MLQARLVYSEPNHLQETTLMVRGTFAKRWSREEKYRVDLRRDDMWYIEVPSS